MDENVYAMSERLQGMFPPRPASFNLQGVFSMCISILSKCHGQMDTDTALRALTDKHGSQKHTL